MLARCLFCGLKRHHILLVLCFRQLGNPTSDLEPQAPNTRKKSASLKNQGPITLTRGRVGENLNLLSFGLPTIYTSPLHRRLRRKKEGKKQTGRVCERGAPKLAFRMGSLFFPFLEEMVSENCISCMPAISPASPCSPQQRKSYGIFHR